MVAFAEGVPCWVDVSLPDVRAGKRFYGDLFGWTFDPEGDADSVPAYGSYVNAFSDGKRVASLAAKRDGRMPTAWGVYFATSDAVALVERIKEAGGGMVMDPTIVGPYGTMAQGVDPGGAVFGLWQPGSHSGFEKQGEPGSFCWAEVYTRDKESVDLFYESVFGFVGKDLPDEPADFRAWSPAGSEPGGDSAVGGRSVITDAFPKEMPGHFLVYFSVADCDETVAETVRLGGRVRESAADTPYGRVAGLVDNQGATFAVLAEPEAA